MVSIFTGLGAGFERGSGASLGSLGLLGSGPLGRNGEQVSLNAATGNLLISQRDEFLVGRGPDSAISRTYNSLGAWDGDNDDYWRASAYRRVYNLTGTYGNPGSTVTRTDWDGSDIVYTWNASYTEGTITGAYVATDGEGSYDTLARSGTTWTWTDGATRVAETYDESNSGLITRKTDSSGNYLAYTYTGSLLTKVSAGGTGGTEGSEYTLLVYGTGGASNQLQYLETHTTSPTATTTRTYYEYDASDRLIAVKVNLAPSDNSKITGANYTTTYTYDGTSQRVATIAQDDGSLLSFAYTQIGGVYRVTGVTQTVATGVTRTTTINYDTTNRVTTVTDALGQMTSLTYDTSGNLLSMTLPPSGTNDPAPSTSFTYEADGDVATMVSAGNSVTYTYDSHGNRTLERDSLGNTITRTFSSSNALLTETRWTVPDPDGAGGGQPSGAMTRRYAYDSTNRLRFAVDGEGLVTEYIYDSYGQQITTMAYVGNSYSLSGLSDTTSIDESALNLWVSGVSDKSTAQRTETSYDFRGNIGQVTSYSKLTTAGAFDTTSDRSQTNYIYNGYGELLSKQVYGNGLTQTFTYDGLSRITLSQDVTDGPNLYTNQHLSSFWSPGSATVTANGTIDGNNAFTLAATTTGTFASAGTWGQQIAKAAGETVSLTITLKAGSTSSALLQLYGGSTGAGVNGNYTATILSGPGTLSQGANPGYEVSGLSTSIATTIRLTRTSAAAENMISMVYVGTSAAGTTAGNSIVIANPIFSRAVPSLPALPSADSTNDRVSRVFYDNAGRLVGSLDAEGYVSKIVYDKAGRKIETIARNNKPTTTTGSFATIFASASVDDNKDIHNWWVYDARGLIRATIDGEGTLTRLDYTPAGYVSQQASGQKLTVSTLITTPPTLANLPTAGGSEILSVTAWTYNAYGQRLTEVTMLTGSTSTTTAYSYDVMRNLVSTVTQSGGTDPRTYSQRYDKQGRLTSELSGDGNVALAALGGSPTQVQIDGVYTDYGWSYSYDTADQLIAKTGPKGVASAGPRTLYYYDADGALTYEINAVGEVAEYRYDALGQRTDVIVYAARIASGTLAGMTGGFAATVATTVSTLANAALDSASHTDFNVNGTIKQSIDALSNTSTFTYTAFGELDTETAPLDGSATIQTKLTYDRKGLLKAEIVDSAGGGKAITTSYDYDAFGRAITLTNALTKGTTSTYDRKGRLVSTINALSQTTTYAYDARDNLVAVTDALTNTTRFVYDKANRKIATIDALGGLTTTTYDADGRVIATRAYLNAVNLTGLATEVAESNTTLTTALANTNAADHITRYAYDKDGQLRFGIDGLGHVVEYVNDVNGNVVRTVAYEGTVTATPSGGVYSAAWFEGKVTSLTSSNNRITRSVYDAANRLNYAIDATGQVSWFVYDAKGLLIKKVEIAALYTTSGDQTLATMDTWRGTYANATNDRTTRAYYDRKGQLNYSIDALGFVTRIEYDKAGKVKKQSRYADVPNPASITVDDNTALSTLNTYYTSPPSTTRVTTFAYDSAGRLTDTTDPEGFVTHLVLDAMGHVTSSTRAYGVSGQASTTAYTYDDLGRVVKTVAASGASEASATWFYYDAAGQQTATIDGDNYLCVYTYDATGNQLTVTHYATAIDTTAHTIATTTSVSTLTGWIGTSSNDIATSAAYDVFGRVKRTIDGRGSFIDSTYDVLDEVLSQIERLDETGGTPAADDRTTSYTYDSFGNVAETVDPRGNSGYFYYDALDRLVLQVDPEGFATATSYTFSGKPASVIRYAAKPTGTATITTRPAIVSTPASDAVSNFTYDKLDRVLTSQTALSYASSTYTYATESYGYNAFGDRTTVTNKLGGVTTNSFDKRGLLTQEVIQVTAAGATVTNSYGYDARGNRIQMIEASGTSAQRTTSYEYDLLDRLTKTTHDPVTITASDLSGTSTGAPVDLLSYDRRGNVIKSVTGQVTISGTITVIGTTTWYYYDDADRKIAQVDALGTLSGWTYDANGNALTATVYGDFLTTLPTTGGGTPPSPVSSTNARTTSYAYDKNNRLTTTTGAAIKMGSFNGTAYAITTTAAQTLVTYDAAGNVVIQTDAMGGQIFSYYNMLGQMVAQVDQENYLTVYTRDANGNATSETRYATRIDPVAHTVAAGTSVATLQGWTGTSGDDRTTNFTYDLAARRLTETRTGVIAVTNTSGTPTTSAQNSQVVYTYNELGEVLTRSDNGDTTTYTYDKIGRTLTQLDPQHANQAAASVQRLTTYTYDGLNNVLTSTVSDALGNSGGEQHITTYVYGTGGRLASTTLTSTVDSSSFAHNYAYDAAGRTVSDSYTRTPASGSAFNEAINYRYDVSGRLIYQTVAHKAVGASTWIFDADTNQIQYNAYGDVAAKGMNGQWQETFEYDANGHVWRSNTGDGSSRIYLYDKNGNATLAIASSGTVNLAASGYNPDNALNLVTNSGASAAGSFAVTGAVVTIDVYDKRNQDIETREPYRETAPSVTAPLVSHRRGYNAFGEVSWEWSARYDATNDSTGAEKTLYTYNTMGRMVQKQSPTVSVTAIDGGISSVRPTENDYYDIAGRLLAVTDANSHTTWRALLAGTGHGSDAALVTTDTHANGEHVYTTYDVFGNARTISDELGTTGTHLETRTYDSRGNVLTVAHRGGLLTDYYRYDELGQRTQHWNDQFNTSPTSPTIMDLTYFDGQGRVTSQVTSSGSADAATTAISYVWYANSGNGYWLKTTTNTAGISASEQDNYFGRVLTRTDFGSHVFSYTYDYAGHLTAQTNTAGLSIAYTYYNSGKLAQVVTGTNDGWSGETATAQYSYDVDGNRVRESHAVTGNWYDYYSGGSYGYTTSYQDAVTTWDAMNRMVSFTDSGASGSAPASVAYEYDAVGNVRHMAASFRAMDTQGTIASTATTEDYWYLFDSMDRFTTTMGQFTGTRGTTGVISRGTTGVDITYDAAGRRATATGTTTLTWNGWRNTMKPSGFWYYSDQSDADPPSIISTRVTLDYQSTYQDTYTYRDDGQLMGVTTAKQAAHGSGQSLSIAALGSPATTGTYTRDALGRTTSYSAPNYSATTIYDYLNEVTSQTTNIVRGVDTYVSVTNNDYRAETYSGSGSWTGAYQGGSVVHSRTTTTKNTVTQPTTDTKTTLAWWDGAQANQVTYTPDLSAPTTTNNSTYYYDDAGHLQSVYIQDGRSRTVSFVNNAEGQILSRDENDSLGTGDPRELHYYFNNQRIGDISNNGTSNIDYIAANKRQTSAASTTPFIDNGTGQSYADFDQSYDPINGLTYSQAASRYTVNAGDTLSSIAVQLWGDAGLWYKLADANGLTGSETLPAGTSLIVPNGVKSNSNSSSTFRPYDPSQAQGDLSPTAPQMPKKANNCGALGMILLVVIAVAVVAIIAPPLVGHAAIQAVAATSTTAAVSASAATGLTAALGSSLAASVVGGAIAGAVGSIVSQAFGVATGIQDKFSWKGVALAALAGGVSGGIGKIPGIDGLTKVGNQLVPTTGFHAVTSSIGRAVLGNVATQGIAVATHLQEKFDWTGVAVAGAVGGVSQLVSGGMTQSAARANGGTLPAGYSTSLPGVERSVLSGMAGAVAGAATRSLIAGSDFGDNIAATLPDVIGATAGQFIADKITMSAAERQEIRRQDDIAAQTKGMIVLQPGNFATGAGATGNGSSGASVEVSGSQQELKRGKDNTITTVKVGWAFMTLTPGSFQPNIPDDGQGYNFYFNGAKPGESITGEWQQISGSEGVAHSFTVEGNTYSVTNGSGMLGNSGVSVSYGPQAPPKYQVAASSRTAAPPVSEWQQFKNALWNDFGGVYNFLALSGMQQAQADNPALAADAEWNRSRDALQRDVNQSIKTTVRSAASSISATIKDLSIIAGAAQNPIVLFNEKARAQVQGALSRTGDRGITIVKGLATPLVDFTEGLALLHDSIVLDRPGAGLGAYKALKGSVGLATYAVGGSELGAMEEGSGLVYQSSRGAAKGIDVVEDVTAWDRLGTVGRTPGKSSATGRAVIQRMEAEGKIMDDPVLGRMFKGSDEQWYPMEYGDMSHTTDAVSWWNATGRSYGAKAPEVRQWMLKSDNYVIDYYSINRSAGAKLGNSGVRYLPPLK